MVKRMLICDRCGREIKDGDDFYIEDIGLHHRTWTDGMDALIPGEDMEERSRDLCPACRGEVYGVPVQPEQEQAPEPQPEEEGIEPEPEVEAGSEEEQVQETEPASEAEVEPESEAEMEQEVSLAPEPKIVCADTDLVDRAREAAERMAAIGEKKKRGRKCCLSEDQKQELFRTRKDEHASYGEIGKHFGITVSSAQYLYNKMKEDEHVE